MGLPLRDDPPTLERDWAHRFPGDRTARAAPQLTDAELSAVRTLLHEADGPVWHRRLARMPRVTLAAGLAIWGLALYGVWQLVA